MARQEMQDVLSFIAGSGLDGGERFLFVKLDTDGTVILAGAGEQAIGVLLNSPAAGRVAEVASLQRGIVKVAAGGTLSTIGTRIASDTDGEAKAAGSGDFVLGIQLSAAAADGQLIEMLCLQSYKREA